MSNFSYNDYIPEYGITDTLQKKNNYPFNLTIPTAYTSLFSLYEVLNKVNYLLSQLEENTTQANNNVSVLKQQFTGLVAYLIDFAEYVKQNNISDENLLQYIETAVKNNTFTVKQIENLEWDISNKVYSDSETVTGEFNINNTVLMSNGFVTYAGAYNNTGSYNVYAQMMYDYITSDTNITEINATKTGKSDQTKYGLFTIRVQLLEFEL